VISSFKTQNEERIADPLGRRSPILCNCAVKLLLCLLVPISTFSHDSPFLLPVHVPRSFSSIAPSSVGRGPCAAPARVSASPAPSDACWATCNHFGQRGRSFYPRELLWPSSDTLKTCQSRHLHCHYCPGTVSLLQTSPSPLAHGEQTSNPVSRRRCIHPPAPRACGPLQGPTQSD
jgi:hypothetical protein